MPTITLINTLHKPNGLCNPEELCRILYEIKPEVIFVEALDNTYTIYQKNNFFEFGVLHEQLEIQALQLYGQLAAFGYVPVLDSETPQIFDEKFEWVCKNNNYFMLMEELHWHLAEKGFPFLNSLECIKFHEELEHIASRILQGTNIQEQFEKSVDGYENNMLENIYSYCESNTFEKGVFMCGNAHRKSIIQKVTKLTQEKSTKINWQLYYFGE